MGNKFIRWLRKGSKTVRRVKMLSIAAFLYWLLHFLSNGLEMIELLFCAGLYILFVLWTKYRRISDLRKSGINEIDQMKGTEFEERMLYHFRDIGWKAQNTRKTGDFGCDLVLRSPEGRKVVAQLKRYSEKVNLTAVQEAVAAVAYYKAEGAMVITNNYLTGSALKLAKANDVEVWQRDELVRSLASVKRKSRKWRISAPTD